MSDELTVSLFIAAVLVAAVWLIFATLRKSSISRANADVAANHPDRRVAVVTNLFSSDGPTIVQSMPIRLTHTNAETH
jgi:hypothetical protein